MTKLYLKLKKVLLTVIVIQISFAAITLNAQTNSVEAVSNGPVSYIIGGIIALIIMGYLIHTLLRPDKF